MRFPGEYLGCIETPGNETLATVSALKRTGPSRRATHNLHPCLPYIPALAVVHAIDVVVPMAARRRSVVWLSDAIVGRDRAARHRDNHGGEQVREHEREE